MATAQIKTTAQGNKGDVDLVGSVETLLITLLNKSIDAQSPHPILNDQHAVKTVARVKELGYDFSRITRGGDASKNIPNASRARDFDVQVEDFLSRHKGPATVLHLACGLDSRSLRVKWQGEGRLWIDADTFEAARLRRRVMDEPRVEGGGEYRLVHPNINEDGWIDECDIPGDRPVLVVFEGLSMYLTSDEIRRMLRGMVNHFALKRVHGEIVFDAVGSIFVFVMNYLYRDLKALGVRLVGSMDDPKQLERDVAGLVFKKRVEPAHAGTGGLLSWILWLSNLLHLSERLGGTYVYTF